MGEGRFALLGGAAAIQKCYQPANLPLASLGALAGMGDTAEPFLDVLGAYWSNLGHAVGCGNAK